MISNKILIRKFFKLFIKKSGNFLPLFLCYFLEQFKYFEAF